MFTFFVTPSMCYIGLCSLSLKCEIDLAVCFYWKEYKFYPNVDCLSTEDL